MSIKAIVFDLGGVLVELNRFPVKPDWHDELDQTQILEKWMGFSVAREYECGLISESEFSRRTIDAFSLAMSPQEFIARFRSWPKRLYPGVLELLTGLAATHQIACLSNTNESHWPRVMHEMKLKNIFHHEFASFQLGMVKPDLEIYQHVISCLGLKAGEILFLDDSELNIRMAQQCGINAIRTQGIDEVKSVLNSLVINNM